MSRLGIGVVVIVCLAPVALMAALLVAIILETKEGWWWLRSIFLEPRAFVITVDLEVEDERLALKRRINCLPYMRWEGLAYFPAWQPAILQFGERLNSGGAVVVTTPYPLCHRAHLENDESSKELAIPEGHIPYIRWINNADKADLIEGYFATDYFSRPNARVRYSGMTATAIPYKSSFPAQDPFDWISKNLPYWDKEGRLDMFPGFYAWPIPEQQWSQDDSIARYLRVLDQPKVLPKSVSSSLARFSAFIDRPWLSIGRGALPGPSLGGSYRGGNLVDRIGNFLPLLKTANGFEIRDQERGYLAYHRIEQPDNWREHLPLDVAVVIGEQALSIKPRAFEHQAIYDPNTRTIYLVKAEWTGYPRGGVVEVED